MSRCRTGNRYKVSFAGHSMFFVWQRVMTISNHASEQDDWLFSEGAINRFAAVDG